MAAKTDILSFNSDGDDLTSILTPFQNQLATGRRMTKNRYYIHWVDAELQMYASLLECYWKANGIDNDDEYIWPRYRFSIANPRDIVKWKNIC